MSNLLTIVLPSWQRPQRTRRAINSVIRQTDKRWELLVVGDCCPVVDELSRSEVGLDYPVSYYNMPTHEGKYGTQCLNWGIDNAKGQYVCFLGNDDYLEPDHVKTRLASIEYSYADVVHHDAKIQVGPGQFQIREGILAHGCVGGSELVLKTDLARKVRFRDSAYGHDWTFITDLHRAGSLFSHYRSATYVVTHLPGNIIESGID